MITLKKLRWDNCFSYGSDNEINLNDATLTQLIGKNGAGKSSIPLILEEVLFNKNSKGIKKADIQNRHYNVGYSIELEFTKEKDNYLVAVSRHKTIIKKKLYKNDIDISSHTASNTYKEIEKILEIDFKTFSQLVYQNTTTSLQFLTATDANRKKFLIDLFGISDYSKYYETFKGITKDLSTKISEHNTQCDMIIKWLIDNKLESTTIVEEEKLPKISEKDEKTLSSLQLDFKNISLKNKKIRENNLYKEMLDKLSQHNFSLNEKDKVVSYDSEMAELGSNQRLLKTLATEISQIEKLKGRCPTCLATITQEMVKSLKEKRSLKRCEVIKTVQELTKTIESIKENNSIVKSKQKKQNEFNDLLSRLDNTLPKNLLDAETLQKDIKSLEVKVRSIQSKIKEVINENSRRQIQNTRIQVILEQTKGYESQLKEIKRLLSYEEKTWINLDILKKSFSTSGLVAYKLENLVKEFEELTNEYLAELSDGRFSINFVVENDKLNIDLSDNGKSVDILALSSGELARVNTATLISIRKLMSSISKSELNVLFLDEVINVLDELGREKLVEVLLAESNLNTYMVSHGWSNPLLNKIEIIKESDTSRLEV